MSDTLVSSAWHWNKWGVRVSGIGDARRITRLSRWIARLAGRVSGLTRSIAGLAGNSRWSSCARLPRYSRLAAWEPWPRRRLHTGHRDGGQGHDAADQILGLGSVSAHFAETEGDAHQSGELVGVNPFRHPLVLANVPKIEIE